MRKVVAALLLLAPLAGAETVVLKSGRKLSGVLVEQNAKAVTLEMGPGRVSIPMAQVDRVDRGSSPLAEYQARASRIGAGDAAGWADLGLWARDASLGTQAREAFERALAIDPENAQANLGLGRVRIASGWATEADANRSRGLVQFEGQWVTPAEHAALVNERAEQSRDDLARREAAMRVREAEERAAAAEAEAARAHDEADDSSDGIPYWWGGGCSGWNCGGHTGRPGGRPPHPHPQPPAQPETPTPRPPRPVPQKITSHGATATVPAHR